MKEVIDAEWGTKLGVDKSIFDGDGVHIVGAEPGVDEVVSVLIDRACVVRVPEHMMDAARQVFDGLDAGDAFTSEALERLIGDQGRVLGLSWHHYVDAESLRAEPDPATRQVQGDNSDLLGFLEANAIEDWAESGFPRDPKSADPETTTFWMLNEDDRVVAAGNMTEWRGVPADVGVLVAAGERGRGLAGRLVRAMVIESLTKVGVVRYRALSTNTASLAVAQRLGFQRYGGNYLARVT